MAFWVLSAASALLLAGLALNLWFRRPPAPVWPAVFVCQIFALLWVIGDLWASHATGPLEKQIALIVLFSGSIPLVAAWWDTVRRYVAAHGLERPWMRSAWANLPTWWALGAWLFMATNRWHGQFITPVVGGRNIYHWGIDVTFYSGYAIAVATTGLCIWAALRHGSSEIRRKLAILAFATSAPMITNWIHLSFNGPRENAVAIGLGLSGLAVLVGIYRNRLFSVMPVALHELIRRDPVGLLVLDRGGRLLMWNPAAEQLLTGLPLEPDMWLLRALARRLESTGGGERPRSSRALTRILTTDADAADLHIFRYVGDAGERWLRLSVVPVPTRRGHLAAAFLRVEDVTVLVRADRERRMLAEKVQHLEKLESLGLMAGGVAHDFNNLLTAIGGNARLAWETLPEGSAEREHLGEVMDAASFAGDLTHQLLAYAGRARIAYEPVDVRASVEEMARLLESSLPAHVTLRTDFTAELPAVDGDPTQLRQVVMNLVTNAAEAIGDDAGFITIRAFRTHLGRERRESEGLDEKLGVGDYVLLEVSDSGCGMDEETRRSIFDPFFTTKRRGRGLGLAAVFGIVRAHCGDVSLQSEAGRGTTFRIWLPASHTPAGVDRAVEPEPSVEPGWRGSGLVLVVDDQPRIRRLARLILKRAGFEVITAGSADEAIYLFRENQPRIRAVLLDLTMPERGGEEALREMLEIDPDARVLVSSGFDELDAMQCLGSEKLKGFLRKPYQPHELVARMRDLIEG